MHFLYTCSIIILSTIVLLIMYFYSKYNSVILLTPSSAYISTPTNIGEYYAAIQELENGIDFIQTQITSDQNTVNQYTTTTKQLMSEPLYYSIANSSTKLNTYPPTTVGLSPVDGSFTVISGTKSLYKFSP